MNIVAVDEENRKIQHATMLNKNKPDTEARPWFFQAT